MIKVGEGSGGGIMKQIPGGPSGWLTYVEVEDIRAATNDQASYDGLLNTLRSRISRQIDALHC